MRDVLGVSPNCWIDHSTVIGAIEEDVYDGFGKAE